MYSWIRSSRIGTVYSISGWDPPDVVVTTMCPQRVTMVDVTKLLYVGVFLLNSNVFRDQGCQNRHRLLGICEDPPVMVVTTM